MSIFDNTATLDIGAMDPGVIFDHDNDDGSLGSVPTRVFINNNTPDRVKHSNKPTTVHGLTVNGFTAASNLTGTSTNGNKGAASPSGDVAMTQCDSAMGEMELPQLADANFVGADV